GYLARAEQNAQKITRLLTNIPTLGDLAISSDELFAYLTGQPRKNQIFKVSLVDPLRQLEPLIDQSNISHFVWLNDFWILIGTPQSNPRYLASEKYQFFSLEERKFAGPTFHANKDWIYPLSSDALVVLEVKNKNHWVIKKVLFPSFEEEFSYEYLAQKEILPQKIWYNEKEKLLIIQAEDKLFLLPLFSD
ncbi:hypothetical protein J7L13_03385, partial [bacterium]|nr:hypothetical protein [bacterium]